MQTSGESMESDPELQDQPASENAMANDNGADAPDVNGQAADEKPQWQPFRPEDGEVTGDAYAALLKAYDELTSRHMELEEEHEKLLITTDQYLRNIARSNNQVARLEKRVEETRRYGAERLGRDILKTYDNLKLALDAAKLDETDDIVSWVQGIEVLFRDFQSILNRNSISMIIPAEGDEFDPNLHEALFNIPIEGMEEGQIIQVEQIGFQLHDRLLRPAKVGVATAVVDEE